MKKKLFCLLSLFTFAAFGCVAAVSLPIASHIAIAEEEAAPVVTIENVEHGSVAIKDAKESYAIGEVVELDIKPASFYLLDSVSVNGTSLVADENGAHKFALVSGENKISASFKVDEALLGEFAGMYEAAQAKDWTSFFSVQNVFIAVNFLINSGIALALVKVFSKYKKTGTVDRQEVINAVQTALPSQTQEIMSKIIKEQILPFMTPILTHVDDMVEMCKKFIQAFLYSLDDTMESKEKIISLLSGLNLSDANAIDEMKQWFKNESERIEEKTNEYKKLVEEMKEANAKALSVAKINEVKAEADNMEKDLEEGKEQSYDGTSI